MSNIGLQPPMLSLPPELHLAIASYLPWWDVYALRLTCRPMYAILPPLTELPRYLYHHQYWMKDPLTASFFVRSNNLIVCHHCPNICHGSSKFVKWVERGVYNQERKEFFRENSLLPAEEWKLCVRCDKNLQDQQNDNWCCRWKSGSESACSYCSSQMHRIYPGSKG